MEEEFSPYGTKSDIMWPSRVGSLEVERATSDASAITLPIGSRSKVLDDNSLRTVDMAGRILNYWRPKEGEGIHEKMPPPEVVHEPADKKDQDSVSSAETEQPFDVINDRKRTEAENAAKGPITKFSEYFDDKLTTARTDTVVDTERPKPKLNLDALPSRGGTSAYETQFDFGEDTDSQFSGFKFKEAGDPESPVSDPGTPDTEFQKRLLHRRRLQRIRVLAAFEDDTASQASFHSTGTPTKLRERRDRVQKEQKRRKSFGYEDPLMRAADHLETLPEEEGSGIKSAGLSLAEDEYSLFSYEQASETPSPKANRTQSPLTMSRSQSPVMMHQTHSPFENQAQSPQTHQAQFHQIQGPYANQTPSRKSRPRRKSSKHSPGTKNLTPTIEEDRELADPPANLERLNFEKIVGDETIYTSTSKYDADAESVSSGYIKSVSSEVHDAIKDVLLLGDGATTRPGVRKRSDKKKKKKSKDHFKRQRYVAPKSPHRTLVEKNEDAQKGGMWKELAFTLGLTPEDDDDDDDDDYTKYTEETQSIVTKSPASHARSMEQEQPHYTRHPPNFSPNQPHYASNPASPERQGPPINQNLAYDINQLERKQTRATQQDIFEGFPFPVSSLNSDHDFVLLALFAAQAVHELQGVRFDDSYALDMYEDLKISVVELKMPLGLILMENAGGCYVTKIVADGSAARSGGVKVGDQLAAINGQKCLKKRVEDIYKIILTTPEPVILQLAFIRYIGPFRPETHFNEEENSVIDTTIQPRQTMRVVKDVSQKPISDRRKVRNWFRKLKGKNAK